MDSALNLINNFSFTFSFTVFTGGRVNLLC